MTKEQIISKLCAGGDFYPVMNRFEAENVVDFVTKNFIATNGKPLDEKAVAEAIADASSSDAIDRCADCFIGHPYEPGEDVSISMERAAYKQGMFDAYELFKKAILC